MTKDHTMTENALTATLVAERNDPTAFRVEAIDDDGGCEVAVFSGPNALDRAIAFAAAPDGYYEGRWNDPNGLAGYCHDRE